MYRRTRCTGTMEFKIPSSRLRDRHADNTARWIARTNIRMAEKLETIAAQRISPHLRGVAPYLLIAILLNGLTPSIATVTLVTASGTKYFPQASIVVFGRIVMY